MDNNIENLHTGSESESAYAELESSNLLDLDQTIAKELIESRFKSQNADLKSTINVVMIK